MSDKQTPRRTFTYRFPAIPETPTGWRKELVQILEGNSAVIPTESEIDGLFACLENFIQEEFVPRPRCESCRWWERLDGSSGRCDLPGAVRPDGKPAMLIVSNTYARLLTAHDFGCTEWEQRERSEHGS